MPLVCGKGGIVAKVFEILQTFILMLLVWLFFTLMLMQPL